MENKRLKQIIDSFLSFDTSSEAEVRSKLIVNLIEYLGYPPELRAEEYPVYGYEGGKLINAKPADFILFQSNEYVKHKGEKTQKSLDWVYNNSLLVFEAKDKGKMPPNLGQPIFYTVWTRAVAYLVSDGDYIKGYFYKNCTADREIINCKIEELPESDFFEYFSYENILNIKQQRLIENSQPINIIKNQHSIKNDDVIITKDEDLNLPDESIQYMRKALGKDSIGLGKLEIVSKYLNLTNTYLQTKLRYNVPEYMLEIPREIHTVLLYTDNNIVLPLEEATLFHFYRNEIDIYLIQSLYFKIYIHLVNNVIESIVLDSKVFYTDLDIRLEKFKKLIELFESKDVSIYIKGNNSVLFNFSPSSFFYYDYAFEKIKTDYKSLELLKAIEDYYEIDFKLTDVKSEHVLELFENIATIYNGITHKYNHTLNYSQEAFSSLPEGTIEITEPESFSETINGEKRTDLPDVYLFNYKFTPSKITILPCTMTICHGSEKPVSLDCCCTYKIEKQLI